MFIPASVSLWSSVFDMGSSLPHYCCFAVNETLCLGLQLRTLFFLFWKVESNQLFTIKYFFCLFKVLCTTPNNNEDMEHDESTFLKVLYKNNVWLIDSKGKQDVKKIVVSCKISCLLDSNKSSKLLTAVVTFFIDVLVSLNIHTTI